MEIRGRLGSGACLVFGFDLFLFFSLTLGLSVFADLQSLGFLYSRALPKTMGWLARGAMRSVPPDE